ncbi:MAG: glycosyltransferase family 4 protein [Chlorobium sp.]|nr:MAG: glycosyltransferase family 4 protein [Chlorobium sp.]
MKVIVGIPCLKRGGTEIQTLYLVQALILAGYTVQVLCYFEYEDEVTSEYEQAGCIVQLLHYSRSMPKLLFIHILAKIIQKASPDVVHIQYMAPGALPIFAAKFAGVKKVLATVHQPFTASHGLPAKFMLRAASVLCTHFIAVSPSAERSWFGSSYMYDERESDIPPRHFTLYNAVDAGRIVSLQSTSEAESIKKKYRDGASFVFGYIGRLRHEKGVDVLCEAFGRIDQYFTEIKLLIVGDGPDRGVLEERFTSNPWWKNVYFAGMKSWEESMMHLAAMDAVIIPSRFEGFGLAAVEAMAASKPLIASLTGGLSDIIEHDKSGLLFESENVNVLADMMCLIIQDEHKRQSLQKGAFERSKCFDINVFNKFIKDLYRQVLL